MAMRLFTPHSARNALGELRPVAERICQLFRALEDRRPRPITPEQPVEPAYFALLNQLHEGLDAVRASGARVKDLREGMIDFPARREGRQVLLCWQVGENSLRFWRETGAGYAGRRLVDEDGPWEEA